MDFPSGSFDKVVAMYLTARQMSTALALDHATLEINVKSRKIKRA